MAGFAACAVFSNVTLSSMAGLQGTRQLGLNCSRSQTCDHQATKAEQETYAASRLNIGIGTVWGRQLPKQIPYWLKVRKLC